MQSTDALRSILSHKLVKNLNIFNYRFHSGKNNS